jgi:hypothetical protein
VFGCDCRVVDEKERVENTQENNADDTSGYTKSGVRLARLGLEELVSVHVHAGSSHVSAVLGPLN